jgi:hypothetical protein
MKTTGSPPQSSIRRFLESRWRPLAVVFVIALALRVAIALWLPAEIIWPDGHRYERVANNLLEGRGFGSISENRLSVPTQPLLIAGVELIFGKSYVALRLFFAILGAATCALGYVLGKRLFTPVTAFIAGSVLATYPYYVYLSGLFEYPQTFFIFIMAVSFVFLYRFLDSQRESALFVSGLGLGLGILSVPTAMLFLPLLLVSLRSADRTEWVKRVCIVLLAVSIPVGSWAARNYFAYGEPILVNKASGVNFWIANNESYYRLGKSAVVPICGAGYEDTTFCKDYLALNSRLRARNLTEVETVAAHERASWANGLKFVRDFPGQFTVLTARRLLRFWTPDPDAVTQGHAQGGSSRDWIARLTYTPVLLLAALGMGMSMKKCARRIYPIAAYFIALTAPYCVFLPSTRYRLPLDFFLILFAAFAFAQLTRTNRLVGPEAGVRHIDPASAVSD